MQKTLLIACSNAQDVRGLESAFCNLTEVRLLPPVMSGRDAIDALLTQDVDILLLDLFLPERDGLFVLEFIDKMNEDRHPLVFVMTSLSDDRLLFTIRDKIVYCFTKPVQFEVVQMRVLETMHTAELATHRDTNDDDVLERQIVVGIRAIGMPPHLKGHYYLRDAIRIYATCETPTELSITRDIYPIVAKLHNTRPPLVEHAMRNAIEITWMRGNLSKIHDYFGYTVNDYKGKPTNLEFIATMAERAKTYIKKNDR